MSSLAATTSKLSPGLPQSSNIVNLAAAAVKSTEAVSKAVNDKKISAPPRPDAPVNARRTFTYLGGFAEGIYTEF